MSAKVALVTGASSGIGFKTAIDLKEKGFIVYGAARRIEKLNALKDYGINTIELDVTNEESMSHCVRAIAKKEGRIDILINNAGYGSYGAIEDVPMVEARRQIEVNLFGLARMAQLILPYMRQNKFGRIVNISSMGGKMYTSFGGWYHATKFAVEGLSDCMRIEVEQFGIDVVLVEPGGIRTDWGFIAADSLEETSSKSDYATSASKAANSLRKLYSSKRLSQPEVVSKAIVKAVIAPKPKTRYLIGFGAKQMVFLRRILPDRMYDKLVRNM